MSGTWTPGSVEAELYAALKALRANIGCASLARNPIGQQLRDQADAALDRAKARGEQA